MKMSTSSFSKELSSISLSSLLSSHPAQSPLLQALLRLSRMQIHSHFGLKRASAIWGELNMTVWNKVPHLLKLSYMKPYENYYLL